MKRLMVLLLAMTMVLSLFGCATKEEPAEEPAPVEEAVEAPAEEPAEEPAPAEEEPEGPTVDEV